MSDTGPGPATVPTTLTYNSSTPAILTTGNATVTTDPPEPKPTETVDFWKRQARENEARAKANAEAATKLAALEESQKTEAQKLVDRATAAEQRADSAEKASLRYKVAVAKGVPAELVDRLRGDTEAEIAADAETLLALVKAVPYVPGKPKPDPAQGQRQDAKETGAAGKAEAARRFGTPAVPGQK